MNILGRITSDEKQCESLITKTLIGRTKRSKNDLKRFFIKEGEIDVHKMQILREMMKNNKFQPNFGSFEASFSRYKEFIPFINLLLHHSTRLSKKIKFFKRINSTQKRKKNEIQRTYCLELIKTIIQHRNFNYFKNTELFKGYVSTEKQFRVQICDERIFFLEKLIESKEIEMIDFLFKRYNVFELNKIPKFGKELKTEEEAIKENMITIFSFYHGKCYQKHCRDLFEQFLKTKSTVLLIFYGIKKQPKFYLPKEILMEIIFQFNPALINYRVFIRTILMENAKHKEIKRHEKWSIKTGLLDKVYQMKKEKNLPEKKKCNIL